MNRLLTGSTGNLIRPQICIYSLELGFSSSNFSSLIELRPSARVDFELEVEEEQDGDISIEVEIEWSGKAKSGDVEIN
ncbi:hypothetical protein HRED_10978 [Candidatus Haloredivivus sp. G17]|nr:hypothetical protein HRED_10978 [Candidatus Haloredivivus sp. G17]